MGQIQKNKEDELFLNFINFKMTVLKNFDNLYIFNLSGQINHCVIKEPRYNHSFQLLLISND